MCSNLILLISARDIVPHLLSHFVCELLTDEHCQLNVIKKDAGKLATLKRFHLGGIAERMRSEAIQQLRVIRNFGLYKGLKWNQLFELFSG